MSTLVEHSSRKDYHDKWDRIAREEVAKTDASDALDAAMAKSAIGGSGPTSEHEAKDLEAREGLKKAKAVWQKRQDEEAAQRLTVTEADASVVLDAARVGDAKVVTLAKCANATIFLAKDLKLVKLFLEDCTDCVVRLHCALVTSFVEASRCTGTTLETAALLHTVQCDLCERLTVRWLKPEVFDAAAPDGPRVYSAACRQLTVDAGRGRTATADNLDDAVAGSGVAADEQQFVTQLVGAALLTERVVQGTAKRLVGATQRELDAAGETPQSLADEARAEAEREKAAGNQAFAEREYGQAAVHYTMALDKPHFAAGRPRAVLLANRSACFLKLGQLDKATADAAASVESDATYCKAHFRRGLALHAQHKYREALPHLGRARDLEPKNKQILDAIKFAEMRLARG